MNSSPLNAKPTGAGLVSNYNGCVQLVTTRTLDLNIKTDNSKGASRIFVSADRHYPDGFSVYVGEDLILTHSPIKTGFRAYSSKANTKPSDFIRDADRQQLVVLAWPTNDEIVDIRIEPGIYREPDPAAKN